ncbi:MAG: hypothetical protein IT487_18040 [Chromatiaceae bacterium]|nr:hypothetical protein [Chromatiaceae bacterium]
MRRQRLAPGYTTDWEEFAGGGGADFNRKKIPWTNRIGVSPCSGCKGTFQSPFALRSATTMRFQPPRTASRRHHDESPVGWSDYAKTRRRMARRRVAGALHSASRAMGHAVPAPLRRHARADAFPGLPACASLSIAGSGGFCPCDSMSTMDYQDL